MPAMDQATFISATAAHVNFMSITGFEGDLDKQWMENYFRTKYVDRYPKFSYKINMKFGDLYYEEISKDEAYEKGFHYENDEKKTLKC